MAIDTPILTLYREVSNRASDWGQDTAPRGHPSHEGFLRRLPHASAISHLLLDRALGIA